MISEIKYFLIQNLDDSEVLISVIFQALEPLQPQRPHQPLQSQWPQQPLEPYFIKELPHLDDWIVPGLKWPRLVHFCGMNHQKSNFFTDFSTFFVGGCWGQPMLFFLKLVDETQMVKPPEPVMTGQFLTSGLSTRQDTPWDVSDMRRQFLPTCILWA